MKDLLYFIPLFLLMAIGCVDSKDEPDIPMEEVEFKIDSIYLIAWWDHYRVWREGFNPTPTKPYILQNGMQFPFILYCKDVRSKNALGDQKISFHLNDGTLECKFSEWVHGDYPFLSSVKYSMDDKSKIIRTSLEFDKSRGYPRNHASYFSIKLPNIDPGRYTFVVESENKDFEYWSGEIEVAENECFIVECPAVAPEVFIGVREPELDWNPEIINGCSYRIPNACDHKICWKSEDTFEVTYWRGTNSNDLFEIPNTVLGLERPEHYIELEVYNSILFAHCRGWVETGRKDLRRVVKNLSAPESSIDLTLEYTFTDCFLRPSQYWFYSFCFTIPGISEGVYDFSLSSPKDSAFSISEKVSLFEGKPVRIELPFSQYETRDY